MPDSVRPGPPAVEIGLRSLIPCDPAPLRSKKSASGAGFRATRPPCGRKSASGAGFVRPTNIRGRGFRPTNARTGFRPTSRHHCACHERTLYGAAAEAGKFLARTTDPRFGGGAPRHQPLRSSQERRPYQLTGCEPRTGADAGVGRRPTRLVGQPHRLDASAGSDARGGEIRLAMAVQRAGSAERRAAAGRRATLKVATAERVSRARPTGAVRTRH
jgi:hypothetical protein